MFAVSITKNGQLVKFVGFVNSQSEVEAISQTLINKYGEQYLTDNGYRVNAELAI